MAGDRNRFTEQWDAVDPFDPDYPHLWIKIEHLGRYLFARNVLQSRGVKTVADMGCGAGYGSRILADAADTVIAVDENREAIESLLSLADDRIKPTRLSFGSDSLVEGLETEPLDAIVCFETLEHLIDPLSMLGEFAELLRPGGTLILSVPNSVVERLDDVGLLTNPVHQRMFTIDSIRELIEQSGFQIRSVAGQPIAATIHQNETRLIRRKQLDGRVGDEPSLHDPALLERLALTVGYPEPRDVERSYSIIIVAERAT